MLFILGLKEEEEGSDEEYVQQTQPPRQPTPESMEEDEDEESDTAFVSPLDEVKAVRQPALNMSNLHAASRLDAPQCYEHVQKHFTYANVYRTIEFKTSLTTKKNIYKD